MVVGKNDKRSDDIEMTSGRGSRGVSKSATTKSVSWPELDDGLKVSSRRSKKKRPSEGRIDEEDEDQSNSSSTLGDAMSSPDVEEDDDDDDNSDIDTENHNLSAPQPAGGGGSRRFSRRESLPRMPPKYFDRLRDESDAAQADYERYLVRKQASMDKTEDFLMQQQRQEQKASSDEAYDFFTKVWDNCEETKRECQKSKKRLDDSHETAENGDDEEPEAIEVAGETPTDQTKLLAKDLLDRYGGYDWSVTEPAESWMTSARERREQEQETLFVPSTAKVDIERKLNKDEGSRFVEEEGLYIGEMPKVPQKIKNKLENRILHEKDVLGRTLPWFGRDGRLVALPDPSLRKPTRPGPFSGAWGGVGVGDVHIETVYCPPNLPGPNGEPAGTAQSGLRNLITSAEEGAAGLTHCQLEVDIASVLFYHHHLFSLEHHLTTRLTECFDMYQQTLSRRSTLDLERRLKLLYDAVDDLKEKLEFCAQKEERDFQLRRLSSYRREIWLVRRQRDEENTKEKGMIKETLAVWRQLREVRRKQGFSNTATKLVIHTEAVDLEEDQTVWTREINRELEEAREAHENSADERLKEYQKKLQVWKEKHDRRKAARRRKRQRDKDAEEGVGSADLGEIADDDAILNEAEEEKPEPPKPFDPTRVREELERHAHSCRRPPGDTKVMLELLSPMTQQMTHMAENEDVRDSREMSRRALAEKTKIFVKIFFNGKEVCHTSAKSVGPDFAIAFGQIFPIQIVQWPESLKLQICESSSKLRTIQLAEVLVPLCDSLTTLDQVTSHEALQFESGLQVRHRDHTGVGAGVSFAANAEGSQVRSDSVKGKIFVRVGWGKTTDGIILAPPHGQWSPPQRSGTDPLAEVLDESGRLDADKLHEWMMRNKIDPNDPGNVELMRRVAEASNLMEESGREQKQDGDHNFSAVIHSISGLGGGHFRLDSHHDQLVFGSKEDIERNARYQMLQLRRNQVPEFRNYRMIPASEREIPKGLFEALGKKAMDNKKYLVGSGDPLRGRSRIFLDQLRTRVSHHFSLARHRKSHSDVISEDPIPTAGAMCDMLGEMAPVQRPLKPVRVERKKVALQDGQEVKILLSVVRAYDVPVRSESDPLQSTSKLQSSEAASPTESVVCSYVEAKFQGRSSRTTAAPGPNPAWNQLLTLTFTSLNNDFSPETMNRVRDSLHIHLFDEVSVDLLEDGDQDSQVVHCRLERKWLGSLSIPFASLYHNTRVEGTFRLHSPAVLLGYERAGDNGPTYLNVYITLEPPLVVPTAIKEKLECEESEALVRHCDWWSRELRAKFPHRKVNPLVADVNGRSVLMTRYFRALRPPQELLEESDSNTLAEKVAWFVSLIPYLPKNTLFPGLPDIWPTSGDFVNMLCGSETEHAVLLANFLAGLGRKAYVVLGYGVPEGATAYVLSIEESADFYLWNSVTGERFETTAAFCPLQSAIAVVDENNIWGNLQPSDCPSRLRWNFTSSSDWFALFGGGFANPNLSSVQPQLLTLTKVDHRAAASLKDRLERSLRDSLMQSRKHQRTTMHFQASALLRKLLPGLEASRGGLAEGRNIAADHLAELSRISASYKICGFPLHFAYSDTDELLEALRATGVHLNQEPRVQFALAVHVVPYPNTVMSVWVYVASTVPRR